MTAPVRAGAVTDCGMLRHRAPNAGLPNAFGEYDLDADTMANRYVNGRKRVFSISSAAAVAHATTYCSDESCSRRISAAQTPEIPVACRLSGLEPLNIGEEACL